MALGVVAAATDAATRRIPNALTLGAAGVALAFGGAVDGWPGLAWSAAGLMVGLLLFLPLFALRAMGGGDVKLLAAFGAWLGPALVVWVAVYGAIAGGVLALMLVLWRGRLRTTIANMWAIVAHWRLAGLKPHPVVTLDNPDAVRMPYALPIAIGALATLWLRVW
ncbi:MAG: A24 family peptidase [Vicinamibacteraceae bacterium]